jgi:hypothetical protein
MEDSIQTWGKEDLDKLSNLNTEKNRKQLDLDEFTVNHFVSVRSEGDNAKKALYLHPDYDYEILTDNQNKKVLVIYEK